MQVDEEGCRCCLLFHFGIFTALTETAKMVAAFPLAKLGTLVIKQVSKPLANVIKERAKRSYFFRTYVCMPPAQLYHWCEVRTKMWIMNLGRSGDIPKLNEAMAIDLGANMLGEGVILGIATGVLLYEYNRSAAKEEAREAAQHARLRSLETALDDLRFTAEEQDTRLRELTRRLVALNPPPVPPPAPAVPAGTTPQQQSGEGRLQTAIKDATGRLRGS
ncbi:putative OPA3-like protein CG13603 [Amphibalanus amphitrite]|uniref:putative OPA3-like protein CG13603 n=1 Tax=Amphibalanus amphitrite TaxID=1232801 RepID=UPI001C917CB2|nr:putative OPA3-like protein CG13603 [Amphibalanus amphitrite]